MKKKDPNQNQIISRDKSAPHIKLCVKWVDAGTLYSHKVQFGALGYDVSSNVGPFPAINCFSFLRGNVTKKSDDTRVIWSSIDVSDVYMFDWTIHFIFIQFNFFYAKHTLFDY